MDNNVKYYKLALCSTIGGTFYAMCKDGQYYELLTNKKMILFDVSYEKLYKDLAENECELIGMFATEISSGEVSKFLSFLTEAGKEEYLEKVNITLKFVESYKKAILEKFENKTVKKV